MDFKQFIQESKPIYPFEDERNENSDLIWAHRSGKFLWNQDTGHFLERSFDISTGRYRVAIPYWSDTNPIKSTRSLYINRIIAKLFCMNAKGKPHVHHIDGDKKNDAWYNLIYVTVEEHALCHKLLNKIKKAQNEIERQKALSEYRQLLASIEKDNAEY